VNSNPSRPGLREGGTDALELFLSTRGQEVLTAYGAELKVAGTILSQSLKGAKDAKFMAFWNADVQYHTPGVEITGGQVASQDVTVSPDQKLISSVFVSDEDEALFDLDVRSPYTDAMGRAMAEHYDANVARMIVKSSRQGALFAGDSGGSALTNAAFATTATTLFDGISQAKETMDGKKVPVNSQPVRAILPTAQWYLLARSDKNLNRDFNGGVANIQKHTLTTIDDIEVIKSNNLNSVFGANDSANAAIPSAYRIDLTNTRGAVYTPYAAATAVVFDLGFQFVPQPEKQGNLLISRRMVGTRPLRSKTAVELKIA
jgi:hypothetical protein